MPLTQVQLLGLSLDQRTGQSTDLHRQASPGHPATPPNEQVALGDLFHLALFSWASHNAQAHACVSSSALCKCYSNQRQDKTKHATLERAALCKYEFQQNFLPIVDTICCWCRLTQTPSIKLTEILENLAVT